MKLRVSSEREQQPCDGLEGTYSTQKEQQMPGAGLITCENKVEKRELARSNCEGLSELRSMESGLRQRPFQASVREPLVRLSTE